MKNLLALPLSERQMHFDSQYWLDVRMVVVSQRLSLTIVRNLISQRGGMNFHLKGTWCFLGCDEVVVVNDYSTPNLVRS